MSPRNAPGPLGVLAVLALALAPSCAGPGHAPAAAPEPNPNPEQAQEPELAAIELTLEELYRAFCFDAGGPADWDAIRALSIEGACFVSPIPPGGRARAADTETFLADFARWIETSPEGESGLHERIVSTRVDAFGNVAHAWVTFEGFVPGERAPRTRGLDSIQLARDRGRWKVASFTTQYESAQAPLPTRFLPRKAARASGAQ